MSGQVTVSKDEVLAVARDLQKAYGDFTSLDVWFRLHNLSRNWYIDRRSEMSFISATLLKNGARSNRDGVGRRRYRFEVTDD